MATTYQSDNYQVERPVNDHLTATFRSTNINNTSNSGINVNTVLDKITNLQKQLKEVYIRFDTNPQFYLKNDYKTLLDYIAKLTGATETLNLITQKINKEAVEDNIVTFNDKGEIKDSGKHVGGSTISSNPDSNTVATELAVKNIVTNTPQIKWVTYGIGTYSECVSAYNKRYIVACYYNSLLYIMTTLPISNSLTFTAFTLAGGVSGSDVSVTYNVIRLSSDNTWSSDSLYYDSSIKADKATTLGGYGITNAYTKSETNYQIVNNVENSVSSASTSRSLSANMGRVLQDLIDLLKSIGKFLSNWNCLTGLPTTDPEVMPYTYHTGDYYLVGLAGVKENITVTLTVGTSNLDLTVDLATFKQALQPDEDMLITLEYDGTDWYGAGGLTVEPESYGISIIGVPEQDDTIEVYYTYPITSYKPTGSVYDGTASTIIEILEVKVGDMYIYDGIEWILQLNHEKVIPVDTRLDPISENAVLNKVIYKELTDDEFVISQALNTLNANVENLILRVRTIENLLNLGV